MPGDSQDDHPDHSHETDGPDGEDRDVRARLAPLVTLLGGAVVVGRERRAEALVVLVGGHLGSHAGVVRRRLGSHFVLLGSEVLGRMGTGRIDGAFYSGRGVLKIAVMQIESDCSFSRSLSL